ncbi:MAG: sugar nucleotide-binding protein [Candidatus Omnitrophota bacterium]
MKNKILILGNGYIGNRLCEELGAELAGGRISSLLDAQEQIQMYKPNIIINCIGHTGRNVDDCELDKDKTLMANTFVPVILGEAALRDNIKLIHISSGCIYKFDYSQDSPIKEDKTPDFFRLFYSRTKIYAEQALKALFKECPALIVRIRIPLDNRPHPKNLLTKLLEYKKIIDIPNSVTYIPDFIEALKHLIHINAEGIYNVVNRDGLRYPDLLDAYKKYIPDFQYRVVDYKELNLVRTNLILSTAKLQRSGFKVRDINSVLDECVRGYLGYSGTVPTKAIS